MEILLASRLISPTQHTSNRWENESSRFLPGHPPNLHLIQQRRIKSEEMLANGEMIKITEDISEYKVLTVDLEMNAS